MKQNNVIKLNHVKVVSIKKEILKPNNPFLDKLYVPSAEGIHLVKKMDILRIESSGNYTHIFTKSLKKYTVSKTMKSVISKLEDDVFIRIHHSHVINASEITFIGNSNIELSDESILPMSRTYKSRIISLIEPIKY
ncbi:LytR/AlgR family response regulator transcription factor [Portibacter lacus]|uniref:HTH LytTR-type domain-containing protein n=1 Tax=Portibacter lacus TaxID=1099794 RepID=A0AA37SRS0_9BACT|nr:LytTR family DNA-binding domain-containing protein [Portibacter lacus]GLR18817.1 hypothetical protein GCM10007940_34330 [Portibacter lacus]